jgi:protein-S-isoprenylcysteine O-methyltransferase Ste14
VETMRKVAAAKILYGCLFVLVLPVLLIIWAVRTDSVVNLPAVHSPTWGMTAGGVGILLMALGMVSLWRQGGGLPMNAFPPPRYVSGGIYRAFSHPIYVGFAALCLGVSIAFGSASGLWLVTPTLILATAALVLGFELPDMLTRFGDAFPKQRLLPADDERRPTAVDRIRCYLTVLLPWLLLYEAVISLGIPADAKIAYLPFESRIPVWQWTEILYASVYVTVALVPLIAKTRHDLHWFSIRGLLSMAIVFPIYLTVPLIAPPRPFVSDTTLGLLLNFDRLHDGATAAFPSYHVIWAFLAAEVLGHQRWAKWLARTWACLVSASCLTTGMHALVDILTAIFVLWIVLRAEPIWNFVRARAEAVANSWHEWRIGPVRIINHGAYAAVGVFVGIVIIETLLGPGKTSIPVSIYAGGTIGAALWAQWLEGSPALLRPLGFYGGMIGTVLGGILAARLSGTNTWLVLSALVVAAPWIQGIGRLRCLVQGCCHGRPADSSVGIRYHHPQSRVYRIDSLRGIPVHPTPLYSLLWNIVVALFLTRLYLLHTTTAMVAGVYLILSGLGRFVEEAYRGEPQTRVFGGLRLYQWIAVVTVVVGAFITTLTSTPLIPQPVAYASSITWAAVCGIFAWIVTGVDLPDSHLRFSRLT